MFRIIQGMPYNIKQWQCANLPSSPENVNNIFGKKLQAQVEERLHFYESGDLPRKNLDVMKVSSKIKSYSKVAENCTLIFVWFSKTFPV